MNGDDLWSFRKLGKNVEATIVLNLKYFLGILYE